MTEKNKSFNSVKLSKLLSLTLRHKAIDQGFNINSEGFVRLEELLNSSIYKQFKIDNIVAVVQNNDKNRFQLKRIPEINDNVSILEDDLKFWFIKANQGHSIPIENLELTQITNPKEFPTVIHGTYFDKWELIKVNGLSRMKRNHIHFSIGLPESDEVISGMRKSCQVYIYINLEKALKDNILFFVSSNRVVLSSGKDNTGVLEKEYFLKVTDSKGVELV